MLALFILSDTRTDHTRLAEEAESPPPFDPQPLPTCPADSRGYGHQLLRTDGRDVDPALQPSIETADPFDDQV